MTAVVERLKALYSDFLAADAAAIADVYAQDVVFRDPVHVVRGVDAMQAYFAGVSDNLQECRFEFDRVTREGQWSSLWWTMHFRHPKLDGGALLHLRGASLIQVDDAGERVVAHEDVYDLGAMVYEQIPLLGMVIRQVKKRLAQSSDQKGDRHGG